MDDDAAVWDDLAALWSYAEPSLLQAIRAAAAERGQSVAAFMWEAIEARTRGHWPLLVTISGGDWQSDTEPGEWTIAAQEADDEDVR